MLLTTVRLYSIFSVFLSFGFVLLNYAIINHSNKFLNINLSSLVNKFPFLKNVLAFIVVLANSFLKLSTPQFEQFAMFSGALLFLFNLTRFSILIDNIPTNNFVYFIIGIIFLASICNAIIRLSIFLTIAMQAQPNSNLVFVWEYIPRLFRGAATHVEQQVAQNAGSNMPKGESLKRYGLIAGVVMVPLAAFSAYELHLTRKATENAALANIDSARAAQDSAKAAQDSAKAAQDSARAGEATARALQQKTDIKSVKHGLMSPEDYNNKYRKNSP